MKENTEKPERTYDDGKQDCEQEWHWILWTADDCVHRAETVWSNCLELGVGTCSAVD